MGGAGLQSAVHVVRPKPYPPSPRPLLWLASRSALLRPPPPAPPNLPPPKAAALAGFGLPLNDRETDLLIQEATVAERDKTSISFDVFKKVMHAS